MTVSSSKAFQIAEGTATPTSTTLYLLGTGSDGDPDALAVLTHPDVGNWPPITYQRNPDEVTNLDNDVIPIPISDVVMTHSSTKVQRYDRTTEDVICKETWFGGPNLIGMETPFLRLLLEYWVNDPDVGEYITWQPRYKNQNTYQVVIHQIYHDTPGDIIVSEIIPQQGTIGGGMEDSDWPGEGVLMKPVRMELKVVAKL